MRKDVNTISDLGKGPPANGNRPIYSTTGWRNDLVPPTGLDPRTLGAAADGLTDDCVAFQAAIAQAGVGGVIRPYGTYLINAAGLRPLSGQTFDLTHAELKFGVNTALTGLIDIDGVDGVTIIEGTINGNVANQAVWSEFRHCIRIRDSSNIKIRTRFINLIGDGVYVSHAANAAAPYIGSSDIEIYSDFVGTNVNRNGVTLVCCRRAKIGGSYYGMARADEPGAIDLEPNDANDFLTDIILDHPIIDAGPGAVIPQMGIQVANSNAGATMDNIVIDAPVIRGKFLRGIRLRGHASVIEQGVVIRKPSIRNVRPGNAAENYGIRTDDISAEISDPDIDGVEGVGIFQTKSDLKISNPRLSNCSVAGYKQGNAADLVQLINPKIRDCGIGMDLRSSNQTYLDYDIEALPLWAAATAYIVGQQVRTSINKLLRVSVAGTSSGTEPNPAAIGDAATDNTVTWVYHANTQAMTVGIIFNSGTNNRLRGKPIVNATSPYSGIANQTFLRSPSMSADNGDAAKTITALVDEMTQQWNTPLTANRNCTLSNSNVYKGAAFKIVRTAASTGAFSLNIGTGPLKALAAGQWCEVEHTGAAWLLTSYGAL